MQKKYGVVWQEENVDKKGYVYRIQWYETLAHAYNAWLKNTGGRIVRNVEPVIVEGKEL